MLEDAVRTLIHLTAADESGRPRVGEVETLAVEPLDGFLLPHPDDEIDLQLILAAPLLGSLTSQGKRVYYMNINRTLIPNAERFAELHAMEEIVMIGYPIGLRDTVNNRPIFRRGITATQPGLDYEGRSEFLVDVASS